MKIMKNEVFELSIIIVNFHTCQLVKNCIDSILKLTKGLSYEIVVVDNSEDENEYLNLLDYSLKSTISIKIINAKKNLGFGKANNLGAMESHSKYLLFLNSDTLLLNNAFFEMIKILDEHHELGAVGANLFNKNLKPTTSFVNFQDGPFRAFLASSWTILAFERFFCKNRSFNHSKKILMIKGYLSGACFAMPAALFKKIGGFDQRIFMYSEDSLLCNKIKKQGLKIANTPYAKVMHLEGQSDTTEFSDFKINNWTFGTYIYAVEVFGKNKAEKYMKRLSAAYRKKSLYYFLCRRKILANNFRRLSDSFKKFSIELQKNNT